MAKFEINTTVEERQRVVGAIRRLNKDEPGKAMPISKVAKAAGMSDHRTRYALVDLEEAGYIDKIAILSYNKHYTRYRYDIVKEA